MHKKCAAFNSGAYFIFGQQLNFNSLKFVEKILI
nr:MAG TPA: hypothetical protein [Caudoviricetes sp.]